MDTLKGTESLFMIILSLLSQIIDIPNYPELVSGTEHSSDDQGSSSDNSSLVRRNVFSNITTVAKNLFQTNGDNTTGDSEVIFGKPLSKDMPTKLRNLLIFLKQNVYLEGIFRKCGNKKRMNDIKKLLDSHGNVIDWNNQDSFTVHDAASVLKQYLADLPSPLLSDVHIPIHIEIAKITDEQKKLKAVQLVCLLLPEENRIFLNMLMMLLSDVQQNPNNLMDSHNLGLVFAPHLLKSKQMDTANHLCLGNATMSDQLDDMVSYTAYLVDNSQLLFQVPADVEKVADRYKERLLKGESSADIPLEIESSCQRIVGEEVVKGVVQNETKTQLIELYKTFQRMPDSKYKFSKIKKFEKEYPHYIMELNNVSHSPMIRTKSTRKQIGSSISKLLSVKTNCTVKNVSSPSASLSSFSGSFSLKNAVHNTSTPNKPVANTGAKRKVLEMLQTSPTRCASSFVGKVCKHSAAKLNPFTSSQAARQEPISQQVKPQPNTQECTSRDLNSQEISFKLKEGNSQECNSHERNSQEIKALERNSLAAAHQNTHLPGHVREGTSHKTSHVVPAVQMETDMSECEPRVIRRKLMDAQMSESHTEPEQLPKPLQSGEEVGMDYRDIGDTYREYFV